jgi:hypothetical protein
MTVQRQRIPVAAALALLLLTTVASFRTVGSAQSTKAKPAFTIAQLAGPWTITLVGNTGCGINSMLFTGALNSSGVATGTLTGSSTGCAPSSTTQTFSITTLNANGSGTSNLTCGSGCGWDLSFQVSPSGGVMNLADVSPENPDNVLAGTAVRLSE